MPDFLTPSVPHFKLEAIIQDAERYCSDVRASNKVEPILTGKILGIIFEKPSLRTLLGLQVAMLRLGGQSIHIPDTKVGLNFTREHPDDVARVTSRMCDVLAVRGHEHRYLERFAAKASIPVINALTATHHPLQAVADCLTIKNSARRGLESRVCYIGDPNNVSLDLFSMLHALGNKNLVLCCPKDYGNLDSSWDPIENLTVSYNPLEAVQDADVVYTDAHTSMGYESQAAFREAAFRDFIVDSKLLEQAHPNHLVMHCLPMYRGKEISSEVAELDNEHNGIWDQSENRVYAHMAVLKYAIGGI